VLVAGELWKESKVDWMISSKRRETEEGSEIELDLECVLVLSGNGERRREETKSCGERICEW
jgi:hypothetical protein